VLLESTMRLGFWWVFARFFIAVFRWVYPKSWGVWYIPGYPNSGFAFGCLLTEIVVAMAEVCHSDKIRWGD